MKSITSAHRKAATAASRTPEVRRTASELAAKIDDCGNDPDAAAEAHELLVAAVSRALAASVPDAPEIVHDFAVQAAVFAAGAHAFVMPPGTDLDEWISSMPDEALDGLRNAMVETGRSMGCDESAAMIANAPNEALASALAESAPKSVSGVITSLDAIVASADESAPDDPLGEASRIMSADAAGTKVRGIGGLTARRAGLARRLRKFSFTDVAAMLSALLVQPENQTATARIEALIHLAALACRGKRRPGLQQLRRMLTEISEDPIAKLEIPVEDVFVSNVVASFGSARLFQGRWVNAAEHVSACIGSLIEIGMESAWAREALEHVMALLRVSEELAERTGAERYVRTESAPGEKIVLRSSAVRQASRHVAFSDEDLASMGVGSEALQPFLIQGEHVGSLTEQAMGHSALERRPLVRSDKCTTVALPTAISAAVRRFVIEQAAAAGDLRLYQSTLHLAQFTEAFMSGRPVWGIQCTEVPEPDPDDGMREFIGTFDEGGIVHLAFVPDKYDDLAETGLASARSLEDSVIARIRDRAAALAARQGYRRGLTVVVSGGLGRRFSSDVEDLSGFPGNWHQLCVSMPDFMLLGNSTDVTAQRAWKMLHQVEKLKADGIAIANLRGFPNLLACASAAGFDLVPEDLPGEGTVLLPNDLLLPMRHAVRSRLDFQAALAPDGASWVGVQRQQAAGCFDGPETREEYISLDHRTRGEVLACIESASRPWWVHFCDGIPEEPWPRDILFKFLEAVLSWLARLVPDFEDRNPMLPSGPVTLQFRFPNIKAFNQRETDPGRATEAPAVMVTDGRIVIDCGPQYLQSFLKPGNLGDRLLIAAIVRGLEELCGNEPLPDARVDEWVRSVAGSEDARFLKLRVSFTPDDLVYDALELPEPRLLMPEDQAWSRRNLARIAGYEGEPGPIPPSRAGKLLNAAVDAVWKRVEERLASLSRESTIDMTLLNYVAARKEHRDWLHATAARLAVYDGERVIDASIRRVRHRDIASSASRIIAEMALCASPCDNGAPCTKTDLDFLIAEVATLLECASQSDALRHGLAAQPPSMHPNGTFEFDASVMQAWSPMMGERWRRKFRDKAMQSDKDIGSLNPRFRQAFAAEFGITPEQFAEFNSRAAIEAAGGRKALLKQPRSEVVRRLHEVGAADGQRTFETLTLCPRDRWDEQRPANAKARDWYPWRFNRRLSLLRRPLVQLSLEPDPIIIVAPSLLAESLNYIAMAEVGDRPETLFDSPEMIAYVGNAASRNGHEFARKVESRLGELEWQTAREVSLTRFGGADSLGDVDVLCWRPSSGVVYVIECKSQRFDSTFGEIGERLEEYSVGTTNGKRTLLQKHLDRIAYFHANRQVLADFTGIPEDHLKMRSALVTENLGSLQFGGEARERLDVVTDYELLSDRLTDQ